MHHGDVPDDIRQALVEQREDDDVQRGPLGLETEPEAKPLAGPPTAGAGLTQRERPLGARQRKGR